MEKYFNLCALGPVYVACKKQPVDVIYPKFSSGYTLYIVSLTNVCWNELHIPFPPIDQSQRTFYISESDLVAE
jgi:hypothetical protein